jgi:hypothetical protein
MHYEPSASDSKLHMIRAVFADAAVAFVATVVIGLVVASLAAAGIITMSLAYFLLGLAWVLAVGGSFLGPWSLQHMHRAIFATFLAVMLIGVGWYETHHYEKPPSAADVAREITRLITPSSNLPVAPAKSPPPPEVYSGPIQSTLGKILFSCAVPPPDDAVAAQFPRQLQDYKIALEAWGEALSLDTSISGIKGGVRITVEAKSDEGKLRIWRSTGTTIRKASIDVRRVGQIELVSYVVEFPDYFKPMLSAPLQIDWDIITLTRAIERMISAPWGVCHVI